MLLKLDFSRLKGVLGKKGVLPIVLLLVFGLLLLVLPQGGEGENAAPAEESGLSSEEYCAMLEQKAEELIKELPNVKDCRVFITLESGYQYIYATDQHVREESGSKQTDKTVVLAQNENGDSAILVRETPPTVAGIAVVCGGAGYETQHKIIELLCALFDIKSNRINVQT